MPFGKSVENFSFMPREKKPKGKKPKDRESNPAYKKKIERRHNNKNQESRHGRLR